MKHFHAGRHMIAANTMPALAISLLLASSAASGAVAEVIRQSRHNDYVPATYTQLFNNAIDHLNQVRADISIIRGRFDTEDAGAVEAKDIEHVITDLIGKGYIAGISPVIDLLKKHDLATTFSEFDTLVDDAIVGLMVTRDTMTVDSTDDYLGMTVPLQNSFSELLAFGQDLHTVIAATWRDHNNLPNFALGTDNSPTTVAKQTVAA